MNHAPERPGILGFVIGGCLPAFAIACTIAVVTVLAVTGTVDLGTIEGADGSVTFQVAEAGDYECFAEGNGFQPATGQFTTMQLVADASPGQAPTFGTVGGNTMTYDMNGQKGIAIRTVHFPAPGRYTISTTWDGEPPGPQAVSRLKFGRFNFLAIGLSFFGGCCASVAAIIIGVILIFMTFKRRADWDRQYGHGAGGYQEHGFGDYADAPQPPPPGWQDPPGPPPGPAGEPPDPYRPRLDDAPPPDEDRLY